MANKPKHMAGRKRKAAGAVTRQSFLQGALILTLSMVIVKLVGAFFKIPLANVIKENGMGYFGTAYNFYSVLYSLATAGFPIAIARLVAENYSLENYNNVRKVKKVSLPIFLITGGVGTIIMLVGAAPYVKIVGNSGALLPILFLAPSIFFCCMAAIYRGYYEGLRNMYPTAISEVIEALSKLIFGLSGALGVVTWFSKEYNAYGTVMGKAMTYSQATLTTYSYAASAAILGVTIGSVLSFVFLWAYFAKAGDGITDEMYSSSPQADESRVIAKKLIAIAIPIGIGSLAASVAGLIDTTFLQRRLSDVMLGHSDVIINMYNGLIPEANMQDISTIPNFLFGCYNNALTLFMLVVTVAQAFGVSALPSLTDAWTRHNEDEVKSSMESILRITCLFCIPAGFGITALSEPIANLLYGSGGASRIIGNVLIILGIGCIFSSLSTPVSAMLQAVGRADLPVKFLFVALAIKIAINYILCGIPVINVQGAGTGTLCCYLFMTVAEITALSKITGTKIDKMSTYIKPAFCAALCAVTAWLADFGVEHLGYSSKLGCLVGIIAAVLVYVVALLFTKTISKTDVLMLPKGEKIANILEKRGWIG